MTQSAIVENMSNMQNKEDMENRLNRIEKSANHWRWATVVLLTLIGVGVMAGQTRRCLTAHLFGA